MEQLLKELKDGLKAAKIEQKEVANEIGKYAPSVSRMLSGKHDVGIRNVIRIGNLLKWKLKWTK